MQPYTTGKVTMYVNRNQGRGRARTVEMRRATLIQMMPSRLRRRLWTSAWPWAGAPLGAQHGPHAEQLARLGIFNAINIEAVPDTTDLARRLNVEIRCTFRLPLKTSLEVNAGRRSREQLHRAGPFVRRDEQEYLRRRRAAAGEAHGHHEWQTGHSRRSIFNSMRWVLRARLFRLAEVHTAEPLPAQLDAFFQL